MVRDEAVRVCDTLECVTCVHVPGILRASWQPRQPGRELKLGHVQ